MKKILLLIILMLFSIGIIYSDEKKQIEFKNYLLQTGMNLSMFNLNDYYYFWRPNESTVLEITPVDAKTCKLVIAVPWNRAGSFQNYVIYLKTEDEIQFITGKTAIVGVVKDFDYNKIMCTCMTVDVPPYPEN